VQHEQSREHAIGSWRGGAYLMGHGVTGRRARYIAFMTRHITILYFAWLRERTGTGEEAFALPEGVGTVGALVDLLRSRGPGYERAFAIPRLVRAAVNQEFASPETLIAPGDEVAFFPPVTGG
jgi:molybdopterin converting factor subunit 1